MASETPRKYAMFGCKFTPEVEKCYNSFPKDVILTNIWLKSAGNQMVSTPIQLECAVCILIAP